MPGTAGAHHDTSGSDPRRPGAGIWAAWSLALIGGLSVLVAAVLVVRANGACLDDGVCLAGPSTAATMLTFGGTGLAVLGGLTATLLTVRRFARR